MTAAPELFETPHHERALMLVEDNPLHARLVQSALRGDGTWRVTWVASLAAAIAVTALPDMVLLDLSLPDSRGLETLARLREALPSTPIVLLTSTDDALIEAGALQAGAQDFLSKEELTPRALRRVLRYAAERHELQAQLLRLSLRDSLTELYNRRGFFTVAEPLLRASLRNGLPFLVLYADIDGLKQVNDTLGHDAGDALIRDAAATLEATFRSSDIIARVGGDEFAIFAPGATESAGLGMPHRLMLWESRRNAEPGRRFSLSLSMGVAPVSGSKGESLEALMSAADEAAYVVKRRRHAGPMQVVADR